MRYWDQLQHGIDIKWKREQLATIASHAGDPEMDTWNPTAAVKAHNELHQLDGAHAPKQHHYSGELLINIKYSICGQICDDVDADQMCTTLKVVQSRP